MKIPLNLIHEDGSFPQAEYERNIKDDALACRKGDWEAKTRLMQEFTPLLISLAKRRATETALINRYIDAGKEGLMHATLKYRPGAHMKFPIYALSHIERAMDRLGKSALSVRLFGDGS